MIENQNNGQNSSLNNKTIADIERALKTVQVEYDFYANGVNFVKVEPISAKNLFGSKWKKNVVDVIGEDVFQTYCERYINGDSKKPIDFKIACLKTPYAKHFNIGQVIQVVDVNNNYTGTYKCQGIENGGICIIAIPNKQTNGMVYNISQKQGAEKAIKRYKQALSDLMPKQTKQEMNTSFSNTDGESTSMIEESKNELGNNFWLTKDEEKKKRTKKILKLTAIIAGSLLVIIAAYYAYKKYKK